MILLFEERFEIKNARRFLHLKLMLRRKKKKKQKQVGLLAPLRGESDS